MTSVRKRRRRRIKLPTVKQWKAMVLGSDRPGHMFAAIVAAIICSLFNPVLGTVVFLWEWLCSPDVDLIFKRRPKDLFWMLVKWFWLPYSWAVPHRDKFSHSLLFGLPCRLLYVGLWMGLVTVLGAVLMGEFFPFLWASDFIELVRDQGIASIAVSAWDQIEVLVIGAAIADAVHLIKDGYGLVKILMGRG